MTYMVDQRRWAFQSGSVKPEWELGTINALCGIVGGWAGALAVFLIGLVVSNLFVSFTHRAVAERPDIK